MRKHLFVKAFVACFFLSSTFAVAQTSSVECVNATKAQKEVLALDAKRIDAMLNNDIEFLNLITDDNYLHIHSSGSVRNKAQFISSYRGSSSTFSAFVIDENKANIYCNVAVVAGSYHNSYNGNSAVKRARHLRIYEYRDGQWKNIFHQATSIGGSG